MVLNENYKRKEVRKFEFSMTLCFGFVVDQYTTHKLYWLFRIQEEDSLQVLVNLYKRKTYWK